MARASFSTLPLELKASIVEMASDQEDAYRDRVADRDERVGHMNSLSSLALVNKELRALAAVHQFKILDAHVAALPILRFTILPLYGHHIREVTLYNCDSTEGCDNALAAMGQFPALDTLRLQSQKALDLFGSFQDPDPSDAFKYRARMLGLVSSKIETLVLYNFDSAEASAVIRRFPNVTTLGLELRNAGDITELFNAIAAARKLSNLAIRAEDNDGSGGEWPPEAFASLERDPPPIKTLQLLDFPLDQPQIKLVGLFSSTLERLALEEAESEQPQQVDLASITPLRLPRLTHLNLCIYKPLLPHLSHILTSSSTLSHFSLLYNAGDVDATDPALLSFLDSQPTLRHVRLEGFGEDYPLGTSSPVYPAASSLLAAYSDLVHSRGLDPSLLDRPHLTPFHPDADLDYTKKEQPFLSQSLRRTLEFGLVQLDRMDAEGDVAKAVGWVPKLRALEDERLAWKD
ncbi:hypothetical protein RQP46_002539 [Phenoliferia psychrophenolica]